MLVWVLFYLRLKDFVQLCSTEAKTGGEDLLPVSHYRVYELEQNAFIFGQRVLEPFLEGVKTNFGELFGTENSRIII
jgi:hypothetical protein